jgi:hypothetical protein
MKQKNGNSAMKCCRRLAAGRSALKSASSASKSGSRYLFSASQSC